MVSSREANGCGRGRPIGGKSAKGELTVAPSRELHTDSGDENAG